MFRATMCPSSGANDCDVNAPCWYVPWLQYGCQARLAGSVSMDGFVSSTCLQYVALLSLDGINAGLPLVALLFQHLRHTDLIYEVWLLANGGSGIYKGGNYRNFSLESSRITK